MLSPGQLVGNYRITKLLGQGGMGVVYAAEHQFIGRRAAIKVLHASFSSDPAVANRFLNEARAVNIVEHPGLVQVFEYGLLPEGGAYIVMEYLEGETLHAYLRRRGRLIGEAAAIALQIGEALAAAHAREIIHRDLKPDNVMLVRDPQNPRQRRLKILDFGIAKLATPSGTPGGAPLTGTGVAVGTPEYMSPEQCKGHPVDGRSDCYALGVVLYELLTGRPPYRAEFAFDIMRMHVHEPVPPPVAEAPAELRDLVVKLLAKDPARRPTMAQVVERLRPLAGPLWTPGEEPTTGPAQALTPESAFLPTLPGALTPESPGPRMPTPQVNEAAQPAPAAQSAPGSLFAASAVVPTVTPLRGGKLARTIALGAAAVLLIGVGGAALLRESPRPTAGRGTEVPSPVRETTTREPPTPQPAPAWKDVPAALPPSAAVTDKAADKAADKTDDDSARDEPTRRKRRKAKAGATPAAPAEIDAQGGAKFKTF